jgi:hypothetical protein
VITLSDLILTVAGLVIGFLIARYYYKKSERNLEIRHRELRKQYEKLLDENKSLTDKLEKMSKQKPDFFNMLGPDNSRT